MFGLAIVLALGLSFEFLKTVWLDIHNGRQTNFAILSLYFLFWNALPVTLFRNQFSLKEARKIGKTLRASPRSR